MGITGLLPALKPIQVTKRLSEFKGKTIAVDAYGWLHKGVYSCATALATGQNTHKYVDFAMHRVRLLRHHQIEPYLVFDGGPLPAKRGTEKERKQKREENLARGNQLAAQGRHSQARDYYVKCIDVTPQMAYQLIKSLQAESVPYVVAPYEADAQLAYLEQKGIVDGILTEDSDLLVFGCQNVLFKLDCVESTVVSISRSDFAFISDNCGISLAGWSDTQFRAMAILSGCDYLPSISGIGLKTACSLLRKWKTAEQVVRVLTLEGKKSVPSGYMKLFKLAEKCFLHQRVYCPVAEKLVYLTEVDGEWDHEAEAYVGNDIEPLLAKGIASGDIDPITLLPMKDINPSFKPRSLKPKSEAVNTQTGTREKIQAHGILSFFGPNPIIPSSKSNPTPRVVSNPNMTGKTSGKRTLAEVMDQDRVQKEKRRKSSPLLTQSKFFNNSSKPLPEKRRHSDTPPVPSGSLVTRSNKENIVFTNDEDEAEAEQLDGSDISIKAQADLGAEIEVEPDYNFPPGVEQEDGYISPTPSCSRNTEELSSPVRPGVTPKRKCIKPEREVHANQDGEFGEVDILSSPISAIKISRSFAFVDSQSNKFRARSQTPTRTRDVSEDDIILVSHTSTGKAKASASIYPGPDLGGTVVDDSGSEIYCYEGYPAVSRSKTITQSLEAAVSKNVIDVDDLLSEDSDEKKAMENADRTKAVMDGWRQRWTLNGNINNVMDKKKPSAAGKLKRREINVTPNGRHSLRRSSPMSEPLKARNRAKLAANNKTLNSPSSVGKRKNPNNFFKAVKYHNRNNNNKTILVQPSSSHSDVEEILDMTMSNPRPAGDSGAVRIAIDLTSSDAVISNTRLGLTQYRFT